MGYGRKNYVSPPEFKVNAAGTVTASFGYATVYIDQREWKIVAKGYDLRSGDYISRKLTVEYPPPNWDHPPQWLCDQVCDFCDDYQGMLTYRTQYDPQPYEDTSPVPQEN